MELAVVIAVVMLSAWHAGASVPPAVHPPPVTGSHPPDFITCSSWVLAVETNNVRGWKTVPASCEGYVGRYMLGDRYRQDSLAVCRAAADYADGLRLAGDGRDLWVFDVDETSLSNLPFMAHHEFGAEPFNPTLFDAWIQKGIAPPLPESLNLYNNLLSLGIKIVFLTGRPVHSKKITALNLKRSGYHTWEKLLLRGAEDKRPAVAYKSAERQKLVRRGYRIIGNIGDQWSDILGPPEGNRTFKLPDPMYYVN